MIDEKKLENVKYFKYLCSMITNDARYCIYVKLNYELSGQKTKFSREKTLSTSNLDYLRKKLLKCCVWSLILCGAEHWTVWKVDQNYLIGFEM